MKQLTTLLILSLWVFSAWAQNQELKPIAQEIAARVSTNEAFAESDDLFELASASKRMATAEQIEDASVLELQPNALQRLITESPSNLELTIPANAGSMVLQLYEVDLFSEGFYITTSDGQQFAPEGKHYRGIIDGDNESLVAISIFKDEVMGLVVDNTGNTVLGRIGEAGNDYVLYNDRNLKDFDPPTCQTTAEHLRSPIEDLPETGGRIQATSCVRAYWEADYELYQNKGSVNNVVNYLTGLFNESKIIYDNDGISVKLQEIYVWNTPSPYSGGTNNKLSQFKNYRTSFNGDLAHLIHADGGGGVAYVNALCASGWNYGVSNINTSYANYPTYSWSVMVVTHEQGHIMGSQHTHDCVWNGNNTAIDHCGGNNCWAPEDYPSDGGTIMSYCHLQSVGINLTKGFGPQPKDRIANAINSKGCLSGTCGGGGSTYYTMTNRSSSKCVDVSGSSTSDNADVQQWDCHGGENQEFELVDAGSGYYYLKARHSGKCLRAVNGNVVQYTCNDGWWSEMFERVDAGSGYYILENRNTGTCLRVENSSGSNGASIVLESCNTGWWSQQFSFSGSSSSLSEETKESAATAEDLTTDVVVYPNPSVDGDFIIEVPETLVDAKLAIFNLSGKELFTMQLEGNKTIPVKANLKPGMYFVKVIGNGDSIEKKLVVK